VAPNRDRSGLARRAKTKAQRLIAECEAQRLRLKGGIDREYFSTRQGKSHLYGLLAEALGMTKLK
jgi:hypothetical protein